jgi:hypothetical protein
LPSVTVVGQSSSVTALVRSSSKRVPRVAE